MPKNDLHLLNQKNHKKMTLTARTIDGRKVLALTYQYSADLYRDYPRETLLHPYPDCDVPVFARFRPGFVPHFVCPRSAEIVTKYEHHPYSTEHELGKLLIGRFFQAEVKEPTFFEVPIGNRIVDILIGPEGSRIAVEVQLSPITTDSLALRTQDLWANDLEVIWALGNKANTEDNRSWCQANTGSVYQIDFQPVEQIIGSRTTDKILQDFRSALTDQTRPTKTDAQ